MSTDSEHRLAYVEDTVGLLWPRAGRPRGERLVLLPSRSTPRLLVPVSGRRAAASATLRYTAQQSVPDRIKAIALAAALWGGAAAALPLVSASDTGSGDGASIDDYLSTALGTRVSSAMAVTARRANRKPVLQAFDDRGHTIGFVKIGIDALTSRLVDHEADALQALRSSDLTQLDVPEVVHRGSWHGLRVVVLSALPRGRRVKSGAPRLDRAMQEIAALGIDEAGGYPDAFRTAAQLGRSDGGARFDRWLETFDAVADTLRAAELTWGSWHGDWTEWNCSVHHDRIAVWDWERFGAGAPTGSDRLHFVFNALVGPRRDRFAAAARSIISEAPAILAPWGIRAAAARATAVVYLLQICLRYLHDGAPQHSVGSRIEEWAYPAIHASLVEAAARKS